MMRRLLNIRLSFFYPIVFIAFLLILTHIKRVTLTSGQLTLFSVNSFLYAYYLGPILGAQKARVDDLSNTVRSENMVMLDILAQAHLLPAADRKALKTRVAAYLDSIIGNPDVGAENEHYDALLQFLTQEKYRSNSTMGTILARFTKTQENRDKISLQLARRMFSHEWMVLLVLFMITIYFIVQVDYGKSLLFTVIAALLCTGLSLLIFILAKYATLTHKQAKQIWKPLEKLRASHFTDIA